MAKRYVSYGDVGTKLQNPRPDVMDNFNPSVPGKTSVLELERNVPLTNVTQPLKHQIQQSIDSDSEPHIAPIKELHYRSNSDLSCRQVASHCESCPICRKVLMSDNNTIVMYMAIALLVSTLFVIIVKKV